MIAVTGSGGYLGKYLFEKKIFKKLKRDFIKKNKNIYGRHFIHLAALSIFDCNKSFSKSMKVNCDYAVSALEFAIKNKFKNFIFFSSTQVYGNSLVGNINEKTMLNPDNNYGLSKFYAEKKLKRKAKGNINLIILRVSNVVNPYYKTGCSQGYKPFAIDIIEQALNKEIVIKSNIKQYKDFICISFLKKIIFRLLKLLESNPKKKQIILNISSGNSVSLQNITNYIQQKILKRYKKKIKIIEKVKSQDIKKFNISNNKLLKILNLNKPCKSDLITCINKLIDTYYK